MNIALSKKQSYFFFILGGALLIASFFFIIPTAQALVCNWDACTSTWISGYTNHSGDVEVAGYTDHSGDIWFPPVLVHEDVWVAGYYDDEGCICWVEGFWDHSGDYWIEGYSDHSQDVEVAGFTDHSADFWVSGYWQSDCTQYSQTCPADTSGVCSYTGSCDTTGSRTQTTYSCGGSGCVSSSASVSCSRNTDGSSCVDSLGQSSQCQGGSCLIDTAAPFIGVSGIPAGWTNSNATATINCSDSQSGCDGSTLRYRPYISNPGSCSTDYNLYTSGSSATISGHVWICGSGKDNAGNVGFTSLPTEFRVDQTIPTSSINSPTSGSWQTGNFVVSVSDSDSGGSGVSSCYYGVYSDGVGWTVPLGATRNCGSAFTVSVGSGSTNLCQNEGANKCQVQTYSRDGAGNESDIAVKAFSIDYTNPTSTSLTPIVVKQGDATVFSSTVSDTGSGIQSCTLSVDSGFNTAFNSVGLMTLGCSGDSTTCSASISHTFSNIGTKQGDVECTDFAGRTGGSLTSIEVQSCGLFPSVTSDTFFVGTCEVSITGKVWDVNDGSIRGYRTTSQGSNFHDFKVGDDPFQCKDNLAFGNAWGVTGNTVEVTTHAEILDAANTFDAGFVMSVSGQNCSISHPLISGEVTNTGDFRMVQIGGNTGVTFSTLSTTFTINSDVEAPEINLHSLPQWYKSPPELIPFFTDNGNLDRGEYRIGVSGTWRAIPGFTDVSTTSFGSAFTPSYDANNPEDDWNVLADTLLGGDGQRIYIRAYDDIGNCAGCDNSKYFSVKKDTVSPKFEAQLLSNDDRSIGAGDWFGIIGGYLSITEERDVLSGLESNSCRYDILHWNLEVERFETVLSNTRACGVSSINITVDMCPEGKDRCVLSISSRDNAGNPTNATITISVDKTPPQ